jgi:hypothetical protein
VSQPDIAVRRSTVLESKRPVFVLGSPRSGTTLLYHMILSAGNFAVYRTESNVFNLLAPRFGNLSIRANRQALMKVWLGSKLYTRSGLGAAQIKKKILEECTDAGSFMRIVMGEMARQQGVERWADCTPDHLLYLAEIKKAIPEALVIHILRDGRDVALSLDKQRWIRPFPWDRDQSLLVAGFYWEWIVNQGRKNGGTLGGDYIEIHFEDLIQQPRQTLAQLGKFIQHDLNYDRILKVGIGSVSDPNTSFGSASGEGAFNPVGRWRTQFSAEQLTTFETLLGPTLASLGYPLVSNAPRAPNWKARSSQSMYETWFGAKVWLKSKTPLGRWLISDDLSWL